MSIYGEGLYHDADGADVEDAERRGLRDGLSNWEPVDAQGRPLTPVATPEWKRPNLASIYALDKYVQERTTHIMAAPYGMESVCLRLFNVYGPGQALSNPYTGVLAIFASRLLNGQQPMIFEDGRQRRDFVHVTDVARAFADALVLPQAAGGTFNIGSAGTPITEVATELARAMGRNSIAPEIVGKARIGDIRHCFCEILAADRLGFAARQDFGAGSGRARGVGCATDRARPRGADAGRARNAGTGGMSRRGGGRPRPILITGGAGFIGSNLADRLAADGHRVVIYDALTRAGVQGNLDWLAARHGDRIEPVVADIRDEALLADAAVRAKAVFHMAAQVAVTTSLVDPREDFAINTAGTLGLLEVLRTRAPKTPVIFASTNKVYGDLADIGLRLEKDAYARPNFRCVRMASARRGRSISIRLMAVPRARPINTCSIMRAASASDRRPADELHLRPAPDGHGGPGLGRPFPDPCSR